MGDRLATTDIGQKLGAAVPFLWGGGAGSPSNTMWPGPRALLHTKWHPNLPNCLATIHQRHRQKTDRQTDNDPRAKGEPFYKRSPKKESDMKLRSKFYNLFVQCC